LRRHFQKVPRTVNCEAQRLQRLHVALHQLEAGHVALAHHFGRNQRDGTGTGRRLQHFHARAQIRKHHHAVDLRSLRGEELEVLRGVDLTGGQHIVDGLAHLVLFNAVREDMRLLSRVPEPAELHQHVRDLLVERGLHALDQLDLAALDLGTGQGIQHLLLQLRWCGQHAASYLDAQNGSAGFLRSRLLRQRCAHRGGNSPGEVQAGHLPVVVAAFEADRHG